ncbi:DEAD/DEAH box helicase [Candidatus Pelagibacter sp. HIMB1587]|uniref:DEAD/DEAH box helicase n=1 Tax=unclassified Candidatus Pelagibacter TaxID=2647897 RepID=UPI003F86D243
MNFSDLNIENKLKRSIELAEFKTPTPIQSQSIPISLEGKDVLGTAQTGTGKTLAFTIPMLNKLLKDKQAMALIICPTRELATQVMETVLKLNIREIGIGNALLIGGESMQKQLRQLKKRARIIVGTPGRINDHIERRSLNLSNVNYLVLDETDRMLDMGFTPQIEVILKFIPKDHQTLLFSATLPENILKISQKYLNNPERISVGSLSTPIEKIKQETFEITTDKKYHELINQLVERSGSILVFVKTKHGADKIVKRLKYDGHKADAIHGNLRQSKRDRVIKGFRNGNSRILVATDVAARGLDIPVIKHVINYDLPQVPEDYIHRIGRTGRAGKDGSALTFLTNSDRNMWRSIQKLIDPNFKTFQEIEKNRSKKNKKEKKSFNKKRNFRDKNKFFKKEDKKKSSFNKNKKFSKKDDNKRSNFKDKKKSFNKDHKRSKFKKKETTVGYTNNPKYFSKKQENPMENENFKQKSFKKKNKFKNRKRPKNFSFKKHKRK